MDQCHWHRHHRLQRVERGDSTLRLCFDKRRTGLGDMELFGGRMHVLHRLTLSC